MLSTVALSKSRFAVQEAEESDEEDLEIHADLVADRLFAALSQRLDVNPRRRTRR